MVRVTCTSALPTRRSYLAGALGLVAVGCRTKQVEGTVEIIDGHNEICISDDGAVVALAVGIEGFAHLLVTDPSFSDPYLLRFPDRYHTLSGLNFRPGGATVVCALSKAGQEFTSRIIEVDVKSGASRTAQTGIPFCVAPSVDPDNGDLIFAGRSEGAASLRLYRLASDGAYHELADVLFQNVTTTCGSGGQVFVAGTPGSNPFDSGYQDTENGYCRSFVVTAEGISPFPPNAGEIGQYTTFKSISRTGAVLLTSRPNGGPAIVAVVDGDEIQVADVGSHAVTGCSAARNSGQIVVALINQSIADFRAAKIVKVLGGPDIMVSSLIGQSGRREIISYA